MKTRLFVSALLIFSLGLFNSCDTTDDPNGNGSTDNYWNSNALTRLLLRGSVYTLTTSDGQFTTIKTFNTDGNIISEQVPGRFTTYYTYQNGKLTTETSGSTTINYSYDNAGKYIPIDTYDFYVKGLVPGLSAIVNGSMRTDYKFVGTNLLIIRSYSGVPSDTTTISYTGNYPTGQSFVTPYHTTTITMTYADNGMFKTYSNSMTGPEFAESHVITFLTNDSYQLLSKDVRSNTYQSETTSTTIDFTYNDKKDMTEGVINWVKSQWSDYVYDTNGNWTSRKRRDLNSSETWGEWVTETRTITYY